MPAIDELLILWSHFTEPFTQGSGWWQLALLALSGLIAWSLNRYFGRHLSRAREAQQGLRRITLGSGVRLLFPFSFLMLVLLGKLLLEGIGLETELLAVAVTLLLSLAGIRMIVYLLRKGFSPSPTLKAWENTLSTLIWAAVALHLLGWLAPLLNALDSIAIQAGETRISLLSIAKLFLSIAFFLLLAIWLSAMLERQLNRSEHLSNSLKVGLSKGGRLVLVTLALLVALNTIGIDLTALTVFGGALGVGLGFGLQRIASNFISGFILLFDRSIRPGDVISVGESFGWVSALHARYVVVKDRDGVERLIPNENLITSEVINWSYSDRDVRVKIPVSISYSDDPEQAMSLMTEAARASARVLVDPAPICRLMRFGDNGIELELRVWVADPEGGVNSVRSEINLAIWRAFKQHNITIPFPQRDVYLRNMDRND
ncbi:MAG: mechanosensitive ion channel [Gammaproteobacteria bacterium]|nr:mechanosensitive ion channel [Gammaproteobacteria bacterium]